MQNAEYTLTSTSADDEDFEIEVTEKCVCYDNLKSHCCLMSIRGITILLLCYIVIVLPYDVSTYESAKDGLIDLRLNPLETWGIAQTIIEQQQSLSERSLVVQVLKHSGFNCSMLVWGTGKDTPFWNRINLGKTYFLEFDQQWIDYAKQNGNAQVEKVAYRTKMKLYRNYNATDADLGMQLSDEITRAPWDLIMIDSPIGGIHKPEANGRMQSLYMSTKHLSHASTIFCLHDARRYAETFWSDILLNSQENLDKRCVDKMCCWYPLEIYNDFPS